MDIRKEMKVESVKEEKGRITVITTGARYILDKSKEKGEILCYQLLNKERLIATVGFDHSFSTLSVEKKDENTCVLHQVVGSGGGYTRLQINSDSLLDVYSLNELNITIQGNFLPDYSAQKNGHILLIDETGGVGFYPYQGLRNIEFTNFTSQEWEINYSLDKSFRFLVSVFPPRRFNYAQSFEERVVHHGCLGHWPPSPLTNEMIEEARKYANVLVLHDELIWHGKLTRAGKPRKTVEDLYEDASFCTFDYVPVDEKDLVRIIKKAHSLGMKVIPYMSPFYSMAKGEDFLEQVKGVLEKYDFNGIYFDGISTDILYSYKMVRDARKLLGDKILYVHCTVDPLISRNIYCPFIDTYADYIMRAEGVANASDKYLRYVISGYNISNSIGYVCYYILPVDYMRKIIDKVLAFNARFYLGSPETERERLLKKEYFPKLKKRSKNTKGWRRDD
ncbi:MAG: hypothetical protein Q7J27_00845 [Syntrophales bacterium]|nr:hypothetical protein [Syntrophales bacterium]